MCRSIQQETLFGNLCQSYPSFAGQVNFKYSHMLLGLILAADLHNPSAVIADKLGYPRPIVKHDEARQRVLQRFKEAGSASK